MRATMLAVAWLSACGGAEAPAGPCEAPPPPPEALLRLDAAEPHLLPNGRAVAPVGAQIGAGDYPTDVVLSADGETAYVVNTARYDRGVTVVDLVDGQVRQQLRLDDAWFSAALSTDGQTLYVGGGRGGDLEVIEVLPNGRLGRDRSVPIGGYPAGVAVAPEGDRIYVAQYAGDAVVVVDTATLDVVATWPTADAAFRPLVVGDTLWVGSLRGGSIEILDRATGASLQRIGDLAGVDGLATDGETVWATLSADDRVVAFDASSGAVIGSADLASDLRGDDGASLLAAGASVLALDGDRLFVALSGDAAVVVLDAATLAELGRFPVGWYPDGIAARDGRVVVANARGTGMGPNPGVDLNTLYKGTLSVVDVGGLDLAATTEQVAALRRRPAEVYPMSCPAGQTFPVPIVPGDPTPIEHVVLIVRENKTFDSELSDLADLDVARDPSRLLFGERITPNLHALSRTFTLGDNFYTDSEVSTQGHVWLTRLFVNDFMERSWMEDYHGGGDFSRDPVSDAALPGYGSFFTKLVDAGVDFRVYGEIVGATDVAPSGQGVFPHVDLGFPGQFFDTSVQDPVKATYVADAWDRDGIPSFAYVLLPNDHSNGDAAIPGPEAMVHDNDVGTGLLIDRISHHPDWDKTVVFLVEDDCQTGADHVDVHRSYVVVISPWAKRGHVTHVLGSFPNVFATIERILGISPINRYDALATPMWDAFTSVPDTTPYDHIPSSIPWDTPGFASSPAAALTRGMRFDAPDQNPLLGEALWWARKGAPPVGGRVEAAIRAGLLDEVVVGDPEALEALGVEADADDDAHHEARVALQRWLATHPDDAARWAAATRR